jgi:hypothetical protein
MKKKNKRNILLCDILVFLCGKNHQILRRIIFWKLLPHLDFAFSSVAILKQFKKLFKLVSKTCCHLMLNPSWDASQ